MGCLGNNSVFGNSSQYIKLQGSDFVAIQGANTVERLIGSDIRIPYKQLLKSRIILKVGQVNYLLNHLGLGDNATFLVIKATYNQKSVNEEDNYVDYYYYDDLSKRFSFNQLIVLTGNSQNRIKQLYLTNPNTKYSVILDVMVAIIDEEYTFFNDNVNQSATTFLNLQYDSIVTHIVGESIYIKDNNGDALIYINISNINSIIINSNILFIDDNTFGLILLSFIDEFNAKQANSALNFLLSNNNAVLPLSIDNESPIIYFYENYANDSQNDYIYLNGATGSAFNTSDGLTFSTSLDFNIFGPTISKSDLLINSIDYVEDNRDGLILINDDNISLYNSNQIEIESITISGTYSIVFDISDIAGNNTDNVIFDIYII
jgi:hypothetical protein